MAERERIARDLHDTLLQGFQGLVLRLQAVANRLPAAREARSRLESALERADAVLIEVRDKVQHLRTVPAGAGDRFGLIGMRDRASRIGGTLAIGAGLTDGTSVVVSVPAKAAYVANDRQWWQFWNRRPSL
jgi:signal transduction histidine kinase